MTVAPDRPDGGAPPPEWEQAWTLADQLHTLADRPHPDPHDDAGWELRRVLDEHAAAAETLGHRLAEQAGERLDDHPQLTSRPAELYQHLSDHADAATAASRARYEQRRRDRDRAASTREQGRER